MGSFRIVSTTLRCQRCAASYTADVQFKTGNDYALPVYAEGDVVADLQPSTHEGIADAFCPACFALWREDEKRAHFEALALDASVTVRFATFHASAESGWQRRLEILRDTSLSPDEIRALADIPEGFGWPSFGARLIEARVVLFRGETPLDDGSWWSAHGLAVRARLEDRGWRAPGDDHWCEPIVHIGDDHRISVCAEPTAAA